MTERKINEIKRYLERYRHVYKEIENENEINKIYNLFIKGKFEEPITSMELFYFGIYYDIWQRKDKMKKYIELSIEKNNSYACAFYGNYFRVNNDYKQMKYYYKKAVKLNNDTAMRNLGFWYKEGKKYDKMEKYLVLAIQHNNAYALNILSGWYFDMDKYIDIINLINLIDDHIISVEYKNYLSLSINYILNSNDEIPIEIKKLLYTIDTDKYDIKCNSLKMIQELYNAKIDLIELPFKYAPGEKGMIEAKNDFTNVSNLYFGLSQNV